MENILNSELGEVSKKDTKRLERRMRRSTMHGHSALKIYIGTCPDYDHDGQNYTFSGVGGGVPLLTKLQIKANLTLFERMELFWHPIRMQRANR